MMTKKITIATALLVLAASSCMAGNNTKINYQNTAGNWVNQIQVWVEGGAFNTTATSATPTEGAVAARSDMKIWWGTPTESNYYKDAEGNYAPVPSYWGDDGTRAATNAYPTPTAGIGYTLPTTIPKYVEGWQNKLVDVTIGSVTNKIAVMNAPSYIHGSYLGFAVNWKTAPTTAGAIINVQYYMDGVLKKANKYTLTNATNWASIGAGASPTGWTVTDFTNNATIFNPGYISTTVPEPGSMVAVLAGLTGLLGFVKRRR